MNDDYPENIKGRTFLKIWKEVEEGFACDYSEWERIPELLYKFADLKDQA